MAKKKAEDAGPSKMQMVREALGELGSAAKPKAIAEHIAAKYAADVNPSMISAYKSTINAGSGAGRSRAGRLPGRCRGALVVRRSTHRRHPSAGRDEAGGHFVEQPFRLGDGLRQRGRALGGPGGEPEPVDPRAPRRRPVARDRERGAEPPGDIGRYAV